MSLDRILDYPKALCNQVRRVVLEAGQATLPYYHMADSLTFTIKSDGSPVSEADQIAEDIIEKGLKAIAPSIPMIGEESIEAGRIPDISDAPAFWLVDPVDGTKGFASGDYTVNVALIRNGLPVMGVIYAPVHGDHYAGWGDEAIKYNDETGVEKPIKVRDIPREGFTIITNRTRDYSGRLEAFLDRFKVAKTITLGSSLKLCLIAAGKADLYPRFGPISEWDIAAGDAILRGAGGSIVDMDGLPLTYGHSDRKFLAPEFVASAGHIAPADLLDIAENS